MLLTGTGQPGHAWLVVGARAMIVAADAAACVLLGASDPSDLHGLAWTSLVRSTDDAARAEAMTAVEAGRSWRGALHFIGAASSQPIEVEIVPTDAAGGVALMHLHTSTPLVIAREPERPDEHAVIEAQVSALEAIAALPEPHAAARGVLHALRGAVAFEWGAVLRFVDTRLGATDTTGADVVAVYPAPMAGLERGVGWVVLDPAQAGVLASGEPELTTRLASEVGVISPLRRMPAFGMTSRIHVPLHNSSTTVGCVVVYAAGAPLSLYGEVAIERVSRTLGPRLADIVPSTTLTPPAIATPLPRASTVQPTEQHVAAANAEAASGSTAHLTALSEVISGVAHELNNPLTAILGYAQIFHSLDGTERDHAVSTIEHEAQRAARIVRNLLSFARQEPPRTSRVDIEEIVRRVVEVMGYSLEVDNVRTELHFAGVPEVDADRSQLEQVFLNLVNNAQQALQPGGGEIVITTSNAGAFVRVSVADDGPGVPEEMRDRVFEPFFTTRDVGHGPGMGLSTVYGPGHTAWRPRVGGAIVLGRCELRRRTADAPRGNVDGCRGSHERHAEHQRRAHPRGRR